jgi:hypothetical protein
MAPPYLTAHWSRFEFSVPVLVARARRLPPWMEGLFWSARGIRYLRPLSFILCGICDASVTRIESARFKEL